MQSIRFANVIIKLLGRQTTCGIHLFLKITDWAIICNQKIVYSDGNPSLKFLQQFYSHEKSQNLSPELHFN